MSEKERLPQKKSKSVGPVIFVILIMAVLIPATVYAVMYVIELRTEAGPTEKPQIKCKKQLKRIIKNVKSN